MAFVTETLIGAFFAEILLGAVYIWGNPQLCFPDPQNIIWRDTLDEQNIHTRQHRLQHRAPKCEHFISKYLTGEICSQYQFMSNE